MKNGGVLKLEGAFEYFGLHEWWAKTMTIEENLYVKHAFRLTGWYDEFFYGEYHPPQKTYFDESICNYVSRDITSIYILSLIAQVFKNKEHCKSAIKILEEAERRKSEADTLELSDLYYNLINRHYKLRKDIYHYNKAKEYCLKMIEIAPMVRDMWLIYYGEELKGYLGYRQLAIILTKEKKYDEAVSLLNRALIEGFEDDFKDRVSKLEKLIIKNNK